MLMVTDFKIAASILRKVCFSHNVFFVDVPICFEQPEEGCLCIGETKNIAHTLYRIIAEYITNSESIVGEVLFPDEEKRENYLIMVSNNLRYFVYKDSRFYSSSDEPYASRLYQKPILWVMLKDLICPLNDKRFENIKLVYGENNKIDIARYYRKGEIEKDGQLNDEAFIFVNDISNLVIQNAFIIVSALEHFGLSPIEVFKHIYQNEIYRIFRGILEVSMDEEEINDFESALSVIMGFNLRSFQDSNNISKFAQTGGMHNQWWNIGLIEKMIEPLRGSDWSSFDGIEEYVEEFWNKVEEVRQKRVKNGHDDGVPFDILLRIKSKQMSGKQVDPTMTLQGLLSSNRVW